MALSIDPNFELAKNNLAAAKRDRGAAGNNGQAGGLPPATVIDGSI
jgi:hypothetical protein